MCSVLQRRGSVYVTTGASKLRKVERVCVCVCVFVCVCDVRGGVRGGLFQVDKTAWTDVKVRRILASIK